MKDGKKHYCMDIDGLRRMDILHNRKLMIGGPLPSHTRHVCNGQRHMEYYALNWVQDWSLSNGLEAIVAQCRTNGGCKSCDRDLSEWLKDITKKIDKIVPFSTFL
jgi:hypothetical protein